MLDAREILKEMLRLLGVKDAKVGGDAKQAWSGYKLKE